MDIRWNTTDRKTWETATRFAAWQQSWAYGDAWADLYGPVHRAEISRGGETLGFAQVTARKFFGHLYAATCSRGPVWIADTDEKVRSEAYSLIRKTLPLPRLRGLFTTPDRGPDEGGLLQRARFRRVMTPFSTAMIDLTQDEDSLRSTMQGKWRNRLKRAEDGALKIVPAPKSAGHYDWLLQAEASQQRSRRYRAAQPALTKTWQERCTKTDGVMVLTAKSAAQRVAAMMFLIHGKGALYHIGWADETGRATNAHNLILWRAIQKLKRKGVETLELGGLDTVDNPGIARFKLGSGAKVRTLCGTWY